MQTRHFLALILGGIAVYLGAYAGSGPLTVIGILGLAAVFYGIAAWM